MAYEIPQSLLKSPFFQKNWEKDIDQVSVEPCDLREDPLGYRALFFLQNDDVHQDSRGEEELQADNREMFVVGASYLAKREQNLANAGYQAPMTHKAIVLVEDKIGSKLTEMAA